MVLGFMPKSFSVVLLLFLCFSCISGIFVGFSHEANGRSSTTWPLTEVQRFHERSMLLKTLHSKPMAFLDHVPTMGISIDLLVDRCQAKEFLESKFLVTSCTQKALPHMNINSIIVRSSAEGPTLLLSVLHSIQSALKIIDLNQNIKVSAMFSLPILENLAKDSEKDLQKIFNFVRQSRSFITVEMLADRDLGLGDGFIYQVIQNAIIACSLCPNCEILIVLNLKSFLPGPTRVSVAGFIDKISISVEINPKIKGRILGFFVQLPSFKSFHRELLGKENRPISSAKVAIHDTYATNPATIPITVPSTTPTPMIITVPATNPSSVLPTIPSTIPMTTPITAPSTNPLPKPMTNPSNPTNTPITVPSTNPMPTPVTNPATNPTLQTNPVTTPTTNPEIQPVTTPSTTYPYSQPLVTPPGNCPVTNPETIPVSPTGFVQTWCVAKSGLPDSLLQLALDYACGMGGADCSAIQKIGSCYNPITLQAHSSYAFNSYYQRNPVPSSCDFGGTSMIVTVNPSTATCIYPSSSPASNYDPATGLNPSTGLNPASGFNPVSGYNPASGYNPSSGASSGSASSSGSSVLNTNSAGGSSSSTVFGFDNPNGSVSSGSTFLLIGWVLPIFLLTSTGNFW